MVEAAEVAAYCGIPDLSDEILNESMRRDNAHMASEVMDIIHVGESMLRVLESFGVDLSAVRDSVERKNAARGYYDEPRDEEPVEFEAMNFGDAMVMA